MLVDLQLVTPPANEVALSFVKQYLRVDYNDDDAIIAALIQAAREKAEAYCNRCFIAQTYQAYYDLVVREFHLPKSPVMSVNSVQLVYLNAVSNLTQNADYYVLANKDRYLVLTVTTYNLPPGFSVNDDLWRFNLSVNYTVGYDVDYPCDNNSLFTSKVPASLQMAICKIVAAHYDLRSDVLPVSRQGTINVVEIPNDAKSLLNPYRIIPI